MGTAKLLTQSGNKTGLFQLDEKQNKLLKSILLDMCQDIFDFCQKNGLTVMLGGGSALGAVRHQGFIPWDDDIDLNMMRNDYNKFIDLFDKDPQMSAKYELFVPHGIHKVNNLFMKVSLKYTLSEDIFSAGNHTKTGIFVDIFPIEDVPTNAISRKIKGMCSDVLAYLAVSAHIFQNRSKLLKDTYSGSVKTRLIYYVRLFIGFVMSFRSYEKWYRGYDRFISKRYDNDLCSIPSGRKHYFGEMATKDMFLPVQQCTFEDRQFYMPAKVEEYMTKLYGNYMQLPPEDKREKHFYTKVDFGPYGE